MVDSTGIDFQHNICSETPSKTTVLGLKNNNIISSHRVNSSDCWSKIDAQERYLMSKPTCFLIASKPGTDEIILGDRLAEFWKCIHVNPDYIIKNQIELQSDTGKCIEFNMKCGKVITVDIILKLINQIINSDIVQHRGYVLSGLPLIKTFDSDDCCKRLYSEFAVLIAQDILFEIISKLKTVVKLFQTESGELLKEEEEVEDEEPVVSDENVNNEDPSSKPLTIDYALKCSGIIEENADHDICCRKIHLDEQLHFISNLSLNPDVVIKVTCPDEDLITIREKHRLVYPSCNSLMLRLNSRLNDSIEDEKENTLETDSLNYECSRLFNTDLFVLSHCRTYESVVKPFFDNYILRFDPQYVISLDGRRGVIENFEILKTKISILPLYRVILPAKYLSVNDEDIEQEGENDFDDISAEEFLNNIIASKTLAPNFPYSESQWSTKCPVALSNRKRIEGLPKYAVVFFDHVYILSSIEALQKFCRNPRPYLREHHLFPICRMAIVGASRSGKTTLAKCLAYLFRCKVLNISTVKRDVQLKKESEIIDGIIADYFKDCENKWSESESERMLQFEEWKESHLHAIKQYVNERENNAEYPTYGDNLINLMESLFGSDLDMSEFEELCRAIVANPEKLSQYTPTELSQPKDLNLPSYCVALEYARTKADEEGLLNNINLTDSDIALGLLKAIIAIEDESSPDTVASWIIDNMPCEEVYWKILSENTRLPEEVLCLVEDPELNMETFRLRIRRRRNIKYIDEVFRYTDDPLASIKRESLLEGRSSTFMQSFRKMTSLLEIKNSFDADNASEKHSDSVTMVAVVPSRLEQFLDKIKAYEEARSRLTVLMNNLSIHPINLTVPKAWLPSDLLSECLRKLRYHYGVSHKPYLPTGNEEAGENDDNEDMRYSNYDTQFLGISRFYCPVTLRKHGVLWGGKEEFALTYKQRLYMMATQEAYDEFVLDPEHFIQDECPIPFIPPWRICVTGPLGSGCTTLSKLLADKMGIIYVNFPDFLLNYFLQNKEDNCRDKYNWLIEADILNIKHPQGQQHEADDEEMVALLREYLINGTAPLPFDLFCDAVSKLWFSKPFNMAGVIIDGFPRHSNDLELMKEFFAIPDMIINLNAGFSEVCDRLMSGYTNAWKEKQEVFKKICDDENQDALLKYELHREACFIGNMIYIEMLHYACGTSKELTDTNSQAEVQRSSKSVIGVKEDLEKIRQTENEPLNGKMDDANLYEKSKELSYSFFSQISNDSLVWKYPLLPLTDEEVELISEKIDSELPPLSFDEEWENEESAYERIDTCLSEWYETDVAILESLKVIADSELIPWLSYDSVTKPEEILRTVYKRIAEIKSRNESFFEQIHMVNTELAELLLQSGFYFLSKFGVTCPVRVFEENSYVQMYLQDVANERIFPVLHRSFVYFCSGEENCSKFCNNPLKYVCTSKANLILHAPIKIAVTGPPKCGKSTLSKRFQKEYGIGVISKGSSCRFIMGHYPWTYLSKQIHLKLDTGDSLSIELLVEAAKFAATDIASLTKGFVLDGFPQDSTELESLQCNEIFPYVIFDLKGDEYVCSEYLRSCPDVDSNHLPRYSYSYLIHLYSQWKKSKLYLQTILEKEYQNVEAIPGLWSKWHIWWESNRIFVLYMKDVVMYLRNPYAEAIYSGRLCITNEEFSSRRSNLVDYCPVCLSQGLLVRNYESKDKMGFVLWDCKFYWFCRDHLQNFIDYPYVINVQLPSDLPQRCDDFSNYELYERGRCIVTFSDNFPNRCTVQGKTDFSVIYKNIIYLFADDTCMEKFLTEPKKYFNKKIHFEPRVPLLTVCLTDLPNLGYLEQSLSDIIIQATINLAKVKPKYPGLTASVSAAIMIGLFLKCNNPESSSDHVEFYSKVMEDFVAKCDISNYLEVMKTMRNPFADTPTCCTSSVSEVQSFSGSHRTSSPEEFQRFSESFEFTNTDVAVESTDTFSTSEIS